ncbi:MAG: hypothetical protein JRG86_12025 [Deltaproteobacteria bacterium]|nr:hypothetical protein [Deltaproteobacteria bacterium]MBW2500401.1 hypothetical protein [Deltaproteobacteria bacterium]
MSNLTSVAVALGLILGIAAPMGSVRAQELDSPRPTMRVVFEEMKELIPLSLDEERWSAPESREKILAALDRLEGAAAVLESHGRRREAGFNELALGLAADLRETRERFRLGQAEEARFFLTGSLQNCVACHVRLPSDRSFPLAEQLTDKMEIDALDPREKAWLLVTVRRFDEALSVWEGLIVDPELPASQLDASGVLVDYLNVAIRVRGAIRRVSKTLEDFAAREDLPVYLDRRVREWRAALDGLNPKKFGETAPASLELGVSLAREAGEVAEGPYGRDGLIQDLAAASHLVRWLEQDRARRAARTRNLTEKERGKIARAYYWLGVVEARSLDGFWVNLSERHLEAAIRSDPKGPLAERAYALLEETQVLGYGGSSGVHLPTDVWNTLKELRELMGLEQE